MQSHDNPRIYVACLAAYNSGTLHGRWIDAAQDADTIHEEIRAMLAESPEPGAEEFAIHDHDGFAGMPIGEYESIDHVAKLAELLDEHGPAFAKFWSNDPSTDDLDELGARFEEAFAGEWDSEEEFAQDLADQVRPFSSDSETAQVLDSWPYSYIDWERATRDLFSGDYWSTSAPDFKVYVFRGI